MKLIKYINNKMNIKLVYRETNFNLDVMEDTPCQYLYRVAQKVFRKKLNDLLLFYGKIMIENDSRLLFDVMGKEDKEDIQEEEIIVVKLKKEYYNENDTKYKLKTLKTKNNKNNSNNGKLPIILGTGFEKEVKKQKNKKLPIKCQMCSHKNSIFYCRECNMFVCFECNIRYTEHHRHKRINLEDGDTKLGIQTYKEKILGELKLIDSGYKKFSKWVISNIDRDNFLQATFKLLDKVKRYSQRLSDIKTLYNLDQQMINDLKAEIEQTKMPFGQEELVDIFSVLNSKDKEIENYIKCVDLQIIKTEYNKVLVNCISNAQKHLKKIIDDVESKLHECDDMKFWGLTEVKLYLKDNKVEKINQDIFNNNEENKKESENEESGTESSVNTSTEDEELKKFKMNLVNSEEVMPSPGDVSDRKKNSEKDNKKDMKVSDSNLNSKKGTIRLKKNSENPSPKRLNSPKKIKRKNSIEQNQENKNEEKNNIQANHKNEEDNYNITKTKPNQFPNIKSNKSIRNEEFPAIKSDENIFGSNTINTQSKGKRNIVKQLMTSLSGDFIDKQSTNHDKFSSGNEYPPLFLNNWNSMNETTEKYVEKPFKSFKDSGRYGKKLVNVLKKKNAKKD